MYVLSIIGTGSKMGVGWGQTDFITIFWGGGKPFQTPPPARMTTSHNTLPY